MLNELRGALVRQTATSEVLQVISRSPSDLEPVFAAMLKNVTTICCATFANLLLYDGRDFHVAAMHNAPSEYAHHRQLGSIVDVSPKNPLRGSLQPNDCNTFPIFQMRMFILKANQRSPNLLKKPEQGRSST